MQLAGMNSQWVISAHIPKVKRKPNKRVATSKTKVAPFEVESSENNLLDNITSIYRMNMNPSSNLLEVFYKISNFFNTCYFLQLLFVTPTYLAAT